VPCDLKPNGRSQPTVALAGKSIGRNHLGSGAIMRRGASRVSLAGGKTASDTNSGSRSRKAPYGWSSVAGRPIALFDTAAAPRALEPSPRTKIGQDGQELPPHISLMMSRNLPGTLCSGEELELRGKGAWVKAEGDPQPHFELENEGEAG